MLFLISSGLVFFAIAGVCTSQPATENLNGAEWIRKFNLIPQGANRPFVSQVNNIGNLTYDLPPALNNRGSRHVGTWSYTLFHENDTARFSRYPGSCVINHIRGRAVNMYMLDPFSGNFTSTQLGPRDDGFIAAIEPGVFVALELKRRGRPGGFALLGITIIPEFKESDMQGTNRALLMQMFPQHSQMIRRFTDEFSFV